MAPVHQSVTRSNTRAFRRSTPLAARSLWAHRRPTLGTLSGRRCTRNDESGPRRSARGRPEELALRGAVRRVVADRDQPLYTEGDSQLGDFIEDSEAVVAVDAVSFTLLQDQLQSVLDTLSEREPAWCGCVSVSPTANLVPSTRSARFTALPASASVRSSPKRCRSHGPLLAFPKPHQISGTPLTCGLGRLMTCNTSKIPSGPERQTRRARQVVIDQLGVGFRSVCRAPSGGQLGDVLLGWRSGSPAARYSGPRPDIAG